MKKILNIFFAALMLTALTMFTGCPVNDGGEGGSGGDGVGSGGNPFNPSNEIQLPENVWADGNIATSSGVQWFKFTATATTQYIHINLNTLTDLYVQLYNDSGNAVESRINIYNSSTNKYISRSLTVEKDYHIKITTFSSSYSGTYQIAFNTSATAPAITVPYDAIQLTANAWTDGSTTLGCAQWFKFTATDTTHYIHVNFGTLNDLYVQLYDSDGNKFGKETNLNSYSSTKYFSQTVNTEQEYYMKVWPHNSSGSGLYQIAFNTSTTLPTVITLPSDVTQLTIGIWADGNLPTSSSIQWFKFTASVAKHYIHSTTKNLYIQLYNTDGTTFGSGISFFGNDYISLSSFTIGQEYYIKIRSDNSSDSGTYKIAYNTDSKSPAAVPVPSDATPLTLNVFTDGNIPTLSGVQWFKFTAIATTHYVHVSFDTLNDLYVQLYGSDGNSLVNRTNITDSTSNKYIYRSSLIIGQEYYIKVESNASGDAYKVAFATTYVTPTPPILLPSNAIQLTFNTWANGNIITSGGEQWFKFTPTNNTHYIHFDLGTLTNINVQLYDSNGYADGGRSNLDDDDKNTIRDLIIGHKYHIKVTPYSSSSIGTYRIAFNDSSAPPAITLPTNATQLTFNTWSTNSFAESTSYQEFWFKFTATSETQAINAKFGTRMQDGYYIQLYDIGGNIVRRASHFYPSWTKINWTLIVGQEYHIRVWRYSSSDYGNFYILFNDNSSTLPELPKQTK